MKQFILSAALLAIPSMAADVSLCGDTDQVVCLENSLSFQINSPITLFNGTLIVISIPDTNLDNPPFVTGQPSVPYRIEALGSVTDTLGNAWSAAQVIDSDTRGAIAIRFQLLSGTLSPNTVVQLNDIRVCQYVSDGPGSVILRVAIWGVLNKHKTDLVELVSVLEKDGNNYISCSQGTNSAPVPRNATFAVSEFLDPVRFKLDAVDPETPNKQLIFNIKELPLYGNVSLTTDGYLFQPFEAWTGLDELKFTVDDGSNEIEGRIGFYMDRADAAIAFTESEGVVLVGKTVGHLSLDVMTFSSNEADVRFTLNNSYVDLDINPNLLSEGLHIVRAELVERQTLNVLTTAYRYLFRRIESAETFLEETNVLLGAGFLVAGVYGDLEVHNYDSADSYAFSLDGSQYAKLKVDGIKTGTLKLAVTPDSVAPWLFEKPVNQAQNIEIRPGSSYFMRVETLDNENSTYSLDLRRSFPLTFIPLLEPADRCVVNNPNGQSVIVRWTEWPSGTASQMIINAHARVDMNEHFNDPSTSAVQIMSSLPIVTAVVTRAQGDLDLVTQGPSYFTSCLLPHLASQTTTWRNRFTFATETPTDLRWSFGNGSVALGQVDSPGSFAYEFPSYIPTPNKSWTLLDVGGPNNPHVNGYLTFSHRNGSGGSASIAPQNTDQFEPGRTARSYFLPHVAQDPLLFWTGYSLLNPDPLRSATLIMTGFSSQGVEVARESISIAAGSQDVAVIGVDRLVDARPSWIRIDSSQPLVGVELVGGVTKEQPYLAGFTLPATPRSILSFPYVEGNEETWTGIAVVNVSDEIADLEFQFRNLDGSIAKSSTIRVAPQAKTTTLAPLGFSGSVICKERLDRPVLVGFGLVGDEDRTELGGYPAH